MKLGNILESIFKYTGVRFIVKGISNWLGIDCGCNERKEALNNIFRNGK